MTGGPTMRFRTHLSLYYAYADNIVVMGICEKQANRTQCNDQERI